MNKNEAKASQSAENLKSKGNNLTSTFNVKCSMFQRATLPFWPQFIPFRQTRVIATRMSRASTGDEAGIWSVATDQNGKVLSKAAVIDYISSDFGRVRPRNKRPHRKSAYGFYDVTWLRCCMRLECLYGAMTEIQAFCLDGIELRTAVFWVWIQFQFAPWARYFAFAFAFLEWGFSDFSQM
jgi:hypothetical protein